MAGNNLNVTFSTCLQFVLIEFFCWLVRWFDLVWTGFSNKLSKPASKQWFFKGWDFRYDSVMRWIWETKEPPFWPEVVLCCFFSDCGYWVVLILTLDWLLKSSRPGEKPSHLQSDPGVTTMAPRTPNFMANSVAGGSLPGWWWVSCIHLCCISDDSRLWVCADLITQPVRIGQQNQLLSLISGSSRYPREGNTHFYFIWPWESYRLTS